MRVITEAALTQGFPVGRLPFGTVVKRAEGGDGDTFYMVVSPMDGSGDRVLCTLHGGVVKRVNQGLLVVPLLATLHIHGIDPEYT